MKKHIPISCLSLPMSVRYIINLSQMDLNEFFCPSFNQSEHRSEVEIAEVCRDWSKLDFQCAASFI